MKDFEIIIIGGSYAGLSAAMALGRSLRQVLVIDSGSPCNKQTPYSHNFLTQDGGTPQAIATLARQQVAKYETIRFHQGLASSGIKTTTGFTVTTETGEHFSSKKLIFATGLRDEMPDIQGFAACWGISIIHCPYCHGYEYRGQNTAIMANGNKGFHLASLVSQLTDQVTLITNGMADFDASQRQKLHENKIKIVEKEICEIGHQEGQLRHVLFADQSNLSFDAVYAAIPFSQQSDLPVTLGCELSEHGLIHVDSQYRTTIDGVFACGDNSGMMRSVAQAVYSGNLTGAVVNGLLAAL